MNLGFAFRVCFWLDLLPTCGTMLAATSSPVLPRRHCVRGVSTRASAESSAPTPAPERCASCGVPVGSMKCDGTGRIGGGIGAVPGFGWWPIKASPSRRKRGALFNKDHVLCIFPAAMSSRRLHCT